MATVIKRLVDAYSYAMVDLSDKRMDNYPLMRTPIATIAITIAYLIFVLKVGPALMKNRKPFVLRNTLIVYNAAQMIVCAAAVILATPHIEFSKWYCNPPSPDHVDPPIFKYAGYVYFVLKLVDLLDTVFFVLKKNYRQITVLHLYHHSIMPIGTWFFGKYYPSGHTTYVPYINMIVHAIMYGYYMLSAYDSSYKKNIWWKKHITQLQLFQFGIGFVLFGVPLFYECAYPRHIMIILTLLNMVMTGLFGNFYYQSYIKKKTA